METATAMGPYPAWVNEKAAKNGNDSRLTGILRRLLYVAFFIFFDVFVLNIDTPYSRSKGAPTPDRLSWASQSEVSEAPLSLSKAFWKVPHPYITTAGAPTPCFATNPVFLVFYSFRHQLLAVFRFVQFLEQVLYITSIFGIGVVDYTMSLYW